MAYDENKLKQFKNTVLSEAEKEIEKIKKETIDFEKTELEKARQDEYDKIFNVMQERVHDIQWKYKRELTKKSLNVKREILILRNELVEKLFLEAREKLLAFSKSNDYEHFLIELAKKVYNDFKCDDIEILLREDDMKFKDAFKKIFNIDSFSIDKTNKLGGFKVINHKDNILLDCTIEDKLLKQRRLFYENSSFEISGLEEELKLG